MEQEQPIQPEVVTRMRELASLIDVILNGELKGEARVWAFALLVFPFGHGDDHRSNYLSNANREDMIATMKEFIARAEGRYQETK